MLPDRYRDELTTSLGFLCRLAGQGQEVLARPVPACPGWALEDLFGHVGSIERWAAAVVLSGKPSEEPPPPSEGAAQWFLDGTRDFLEVMASLDPAAPCWNFGPPPRTAGFWLRRQAHEHAIHLVDACQASGVAPPQLGDDFLLDGVDEVLAMFAPRQIRRERMPRPERAVAFRIEAGSSWTIGEGPPAASVTAPVREMYLGLWGRIDLRRAAVIAGDADAALQVLKGPLVP